MANRRIEMHQYRQVIHRMRLGQSDRAIAKSKLIGRTKCAAVRALAARQGWLDGGPLPDDPQLAAVFAPVGGGRRATASSLAAPHEQRIAQWVAEGIQATTIYETLVTQFGFSGSYSSVRRLVRRLRGKAPKASCALHFAPAEAAQVDFGRGPTITDVFTGAVIKTWIFVMTLCFSRHMYAELVTDQRTETWLGCHRRAFEFFGGVVGKLIIDNPKCAITRACFTDPQLQRAYGELAEGYGVLISPCPVRQPEKKGRVEAGVKYVKRSFVPLRRFRTLADANAQLKRWVLGRAGNRCHGTTCRRPLEMFAELEKPLLRPLPDVPPQVAVWAEVKVHRNCHVQFERAYYSAPFGLVGRKLWLRATEGTVKLYEDYRLVATHRRLRQPGLWATVDDHLPPEAVAYKRQDPDWCLRQAAAVGPQCRRLVEQLLANRVLDRLRAAQGVIRLGKRYGPARLEAACGRALAYDNVKYRTVKSILHQGLDQLPAPATAKVIELAAAYRGKARFLRHGGVERRSS